MLYATSKAITDLPKPLVGKIFYHFKNTAQFNNNVRGLMMKDDEIVKSHDVVSLFTNVPIDKVMAVIRKWLEH